MHMDWKTLLSDRRVPRSGDAPSRSRDEPFRTPFEADYDRVVYSAPLRRLARKTQVHPMVAHDHVHNRLTHSIEVASVGRSFASRLGRFLREREEVDPQQVADISQVVQCGRYTLHSSSNDMATLFNARPLAAEWQPRYNLAPTQNGLAVRGDQPGRVLTPMRWGLIPYWADGRRGRF